MITLFSVAGGKYHRPTSQELKPWRPTDTVCGLTVTPQNYFASDADANSRTGGRLSRHLCKHCAKVSS